MMKNKPISDFVWHCELDTMKGLDLGSTYLNRESAKCFIESIARTEFQKVASVVYNAKFVCVIGDGLPDASIQEQEMWFVRTCIDGKIYVHFVGVHAT